MKTNSVAASIGSDLLAIKAQIIALEREAAAWDMTALSFILELAIAEADSLQPSSPRKPNSEVSIRLQ